MEHTEPKYGIVDAPPAYVFERLCALSRALALPRPVRDAFLFRPDARFYDACTGSIVSLQRAAKQVIEHLGLSCDTVVVSFVTGKGFAGRVEREGASWFIEIADKYERDAWSLGAILAHEVCHILVAERRIEHFDSVLDEVHVDLAVMLSGLGALTLNAIVDIDTTDGDTHTYEHRSLGYMKADRLEDAFAFVASDVGLSASEATRNLRSGFSKRAVVRSMTWDAIARGARRLIGSRPVDSKRLAFGALPSHAVLPCPGATCGERLRVPTNKRGKARCPVCKAERAFDGTPLDTIELEAREPLTERPIPKMVDTSKMSRSWRRLPFATQLSVFAFFFIVLSLGGLWLATELKRSGVGDPCKNDADCRSKQCLLVVHRPPPLDPGYSAFGDAELDAKFRESVNKIGAASDPLDPGRTDTRAVRKEESYCTEACVLDEDCPDGMKCGDIRAFTRDPLGPDFISGRGTSSRSCVKR